MSVLTTAAFRLALGAAALAAGTADANARPRRVVVLEFDGPRSLADTGRNAVITVLSEQYDLVAPTRWEQARASASRTAHGPKGWSKAARSSGVDAVVEGWIQDEGRHKVLTLAVLEAATGQELESVSVRLGKNGSVNADTHAQIRTQLDDVFEWIRGQRRSVDADAPDCQARDGRREAQAGRHRRRGRRRCAGRVEAQASRLRRGCRDRRGEGPPRHLRFRTASRPRP